MSKWYEVTMQCVKTVVIEMEDNETENDAQQAALGESFFGYDNKDVIECMPLTEENLEQHKLHAEEVISA